MKMAGLVDGLLQVHVEQQHREILDDSGQDTPAAETDSHDRLAVLDRQEIWGTQCS